MNYDKWKLSTPPETGEKECYYCGELSDNIFCSEECKQLDKIDNG